MIAIILSGPPASGKETQGGFIAQHLDCPILVTSKILEEDGHIEAMEKGVNVQDHHVFESVLKRVNAENHCIFDGLTRSPEQALIFPDELREAGFERVIAIELHLTDKKIATERCYQRKSEGKSSDRPDGDNPHTFVQRFERHVAEADSVRSILMETCDDYFAVDARKSREFIGRRIYHLIVMIMGELGYQNQTVPYDFMGDFDLMGVR